MLIALLDHPDRPTRDLSSIRTVMSGSSTVPAELVRRTRAAVDCDFSVLFGQTELHGVLTQTHPTDSAEDQAETIGQPLARVEVKVADASGAPVDIGRPGEICARGYQAMAGYFDIIIRGGENIHPREIEELLAAHPAVAEVAVIGVPDARWGEQVGAVVRSADPARPPTVAELHDYCRTHLAPFKTPRVWFFVDAFPMTPSGKIQKFVLKDLMAAGELQPSEQQ